jgi:hypothetical protein
LRKAKIIDPILNREDHVQLARDVALIQDTCYTYFTSKEEPEDGGTDKQSDSPELGDEDSERGGDSV